MDAAIVALSARARRASDRCPRCNAPIVGASPSGRRARRQNAAISAQVAMTSIPIFENRRLSSCRKIASLGQRMHMSDFTHLYAITWRLGVIPQRHYLVADLDLVAIFVAFRFTLCWTIATGIIFREHCVRVQYVLIYGFPATTTFDSVSSCAKHSNFPRILCGAGHATVRHPIFPNFVGNREVRGWSHQMCQRISLLPGRSLACSGCPPL